MKHVKDCLRLLLFIPLVLIFFSCSPSLPANRELDSSTDAISDSVVVVTPESVLTPAPATPAPATPAPPTPTPEPPFEEYGISLMALGDNLLHMAVVKTGIQSDGTYDYSFLYQGVSDFLEAADIKVANQETVFGGNELGFSGYPLFNSPTEVGDATAAAGFNVVLHATNHTADQGIDGLKHCADFWKKYPDVLALGIHSEETYGEIPLLEIKGVTFAVLNYTYGPNASSVNSSLRGHLDMLCDYDRQTGAINFTALNPQVIEDIHAARELADVVIVFPHWGTEYQTTASKYQKLFASQLAEAGADLIIGTHPHVPQPVEWLTCEDGRKTLCFYSLGNYVSTQNKKECMLEAMAWVNFHVTEDGVSIKEEGTGMLPLVCHYVKNTLRMKQVYLLEDYTEELAVAHGITYYDGLVLHLSDLESQCEETFGDMRLYRADILGGE